MYDLFHFASSSYFEIFAAQLVDEQAVFVDLADQLLDLRFRGITLLW